MKELTDKFKNLSLNSNILLNLFRHISINMDKSKLKINNYSEFCFLKVQKNLLRSLF